MSKTAVLIDGSFYLHMAEKHWGPKSPAVRADELHQYALSHIAIKRKAAEEDSRRSLYRIFYYDCPPVNGISIKQPWNGRNATFSTKRSSGKWRKEFLDALASKRKVAMRMGTVSFRNARFIPSEAAMSDLASGARSFSQLGKDDFVLTGVKQEGVDMRIGLDIASLANGGIVDQVVLIAGDCDFIPVAKVARRGGVDFILDPMGHSVHPDMVIQVDGVEDLTESKVIDDSAIPISTQDYQTN